MGTGSESSRSTLPLTATLYTTTFALAATALVTRPLALQDAWLAALSTNLVNLERHPLRCLVGSAFVTQDSVSDWIVLSAIGLAVAGEVLGNGRLAALVVATHVLGTLVSESVLELQIRAGTAVPTQRLIVDVGPSFVVAPALVVGIVHGRGWGRMLCGLAFALLEPNLFGGLLQLDISAVGHTTAIVVALLAAPTLIRSWPAGGPGAPAGLTWRRADRHR